jgi:hypothetical protein
MKKNFLQSTFVMAALAISSLGIAQKVSLNLTKGQKYKVATTTSMSMNIEAPGQSMQIESNMTSDQNVEVLNVANNQIDLTGTTTKITLTSTGGGQDVSYDSDKDKSGDMADAIGKNIGKPKAISVSNSGVVVKQEKEEKKEEGGGGGMMSMITGGASTHPAEGIFDKKILGKDIKVGTTWQDSTSTKEKMSTATTSTYTISAITGDIATVQLSAVTKLSGTVEQMGMEMPMTGTTKTTGTIKVNIKTGITLESDLTTGIDNSVEAMGMQIPITGTSKVKSIVTNL